LIGCGVPSMSSGGISVVSGMLPAVAVAAESGEAAAALSAGELLSPHAVKQSVDAMSDVRRICFIRVVRAFDPERSTVKSE